MRKLIAIFVICASILYSIMLCYAGEASNKQVDLPLASKYETKQALDQLNSFMTEGSGVLVEQQLNLNILEGFNYLGYDYTRSFDGKSLARTINWSGHYAAYAPIYQSEIYKGYYKVRTEKLLSKYRITQVFDNAAFARTARQEFDNYIKVTIKNENTRKQLVILLQERLMDKLIELEPSKRKTVLDEIYSLRLPNNVVLCNDYIYQVFESQVRTEVLSQMLDINKEELTKLAHNVAVYITVDRSGTLQLQFENSEGKVEKLQILNVIKDNDSYRGLNVLYELYGKRDCSLIFTDNDNREHKIDINRALAAISLDEEGYLQLKLDELLEQKNTDIDGSNQIEPTVTNDKMSSEEQLEVLESSYLSKASEAQVIVKELNRYSMYLELKNEGINNYFTRKFEAEKKAWKAVLDLKLNKFGPGGMSDFAAYIKQFVLLSRSELGQSERGKVVVAKFRNSVVQFRQPNDSSLWITDMLYNIKYMK